MKRKLAGMILGVVLAVTALGGCSKSGNSSTYLKGVLDVAYNKGTQDYVKAAGAKEADAKKYTQQSLEAEAMVMAAYFGIEEPSEEVVTVFTEFCKELYKKVSYEVKDDGKVVINQVTLPITEDVQNYIDEFNIKQFVDGDTSCTDEAFAKGVTEVLSKALEKAETKEVTVEVKVSEKDGKYSISDEELQKLDEQMLVYE